MDEMHRPDEQRPDADEPSREHTDGQPKAPLAEKLKKKVSAILPTSVLALIVLALVFYLIGNLPAFSAFFGKIAGLFTPLFWGALVAYLCNPILRFWERRVLFKIRSFPFKRMLGIVLTYLSIILGVSVFGLLLVPSLISSVKELLSNFENYIANAVTYINNLIGPLMEHLPTLSPDGTQEFLPLETITSAASTLISQAGNIFSWAVDYISKYASQLVSGVTDVILAVFISFYLLSSKELRLAQVRKIVTAYCSEKTSRFAFETVSMAHHTFGRYFQGVVLDAIIIFVAGLIVFSIMDIELALMIAFIVAITNVIPVFGPFLGAVPSAFIIFITQPEKTIPFVLAILIMQQIDGNIIAPKILGESTGISSLCVIVSLAVMGGLWGVFGMVIGVPVFAVLVTLIEQHANQRLSKRSLSADIDDYYVDEPDDADKPHKKGVMFKIVSRLKSGAGYALSYTRYGLALAQYRICKKKNPKLKSPVKTDYLPPRPTKTADAAKTTDTEALTAQGGTTDAIKESTPYGDA